MAEYDFLNGVKARIGLKGNNYHDETIQAYIEDVKEYLKDAGCSDAQLASSRSAGVIARGVSDLWNNGSGNAQLSPYFKERAAQLALSREDEEDV